MYKYYTIHIFKIKVVKKLKIVYTYYIRILEVGMNSITLEELKDFESKVKDSIIANYANDISKERLDFILDKVYVNKQNYSSKKDIKKQYGDLIRKIFKDIITINEEYNSALIEYYTDATSKDLNVVINERPDLKNKLKQVLKIKEKLENNFDKIILNNQNEELMNALNSSDEVKNNEEINILDFVKTDQSNDIEINNKDSNNDIIQDSFEDNLDDNIEEDMTFDEFEKTLQDGMLEPINEDKYNLDVPVINDFEQLDYVEEIHENQNNEVNNTDVQNENEQNISNEPEFEDNQIVNENNSEVIDDFNNDVLVEKEANENNEIDNSKSQEINDNTMTEDENVIDEKNDSYMIFYIFAVTISLALIIGIILLKFYS